MIQTLLDAGRFNILTMMTVNITFYWMRCHTF